ncbi:MAG: hypothetical protein CM15mV25_0350 [uncultured marine virus]|nr:MAG: hypothetical protein CM15mV25_0350 [uncultured marine virus]
MVVYKFKSGEFKHVWDDFALNPEYWQLHYYNSGKVHFKYYANKTMLIGKYLKRKVNLH